MTSRARTSASAPQAPICTRPSDSTAESVSVLLPTATPKTRHCTKCKRPMRGHPKGPCPFIKDRISQDITALEQTLDSLRLHVAQLPDSSPSTPIWASPQSEIQRPVNPPSSPGRMLTEQSDVQLPIDPPSNLIRTSTRYDVQLSEGLPRSSPIRTSTRLGRSREYNGVSSEVDQPLNALLGRFSTQFFSAPVTVVQLPAIETSDFCSEASRLGFYTRIVPTTADVSSTTDQQVLVGEDEDLVNRIFKSMKAKEGDKGRGMVNTAIGAVLGATGVVAGLALS